MIDALEAVDGDPSVLAHHAAAAGDAARVLEYAPAAAAEASRSGAHREAVAFYETALRHTGADVATCATLLEGLSTELYLADRLRDSITTRQRALEMRQRSGDVVAVGEGTPRSPTSRGAQPSVRSPNGMPRSAIEILSGTDDGRALGFALAWHAFLAAWRGDASEALGAAPQAARSRTNWATTSCCTAPRPSGVAVADCSRATPWPRADCSRPGGRPGAPGRRPRDHADGHLCHYDVEQGAGREAEQCSSMRSGSARSATSRSAPRGSAGYGRGCDCCRAGGRTPSDDARAALRSGNPPLASCGPTSCSGCWPPAATRHGITRISTSCGGSRPARRPGMLAAAAAALAENAWITRRPDPRLDDPLRRRAPDAAYTGRDATVARSAGGPAGWPAQAAALGPAPPMPRLPAPTASRTSSAGARGTRVDRRPAGRPPLLDRLDARAVAALFRARLRERGCSAVPRGRRR